MMIRDGDRGALSGFRGGGAGVLLQPTEPVEPEPAFAAQGRGVEVCEEAGGVEGVGEVGVGVAAVEVDVVQAAGGEVGEGEAEEGGAVAVAEVGEEGFVVEGAAFGMGDGDRGGEGVGWVAGEGELEKEGFRRFNGGL